MTTTNVRVETGKFVASHGKAPRGRGGWGFDVNGREFWTGFLTWTEARKAAQAEAARQGATVVTVLP